jgi:tRNA(Ile)-lysidine synthase
VHAQPCHPPHLHDSLPGIVARAQLDHALFPQPSPQQQPVVVAVSGGVDSMTLLHILMQMADKWQLELHVAHVDHDLRPAAAQDAAAVRQVAAQARLPFHTVRLSGAALRADRAGLEAAARNARYRFLCATANNVTPKTMVPVIAAAHHADDQAETLLLRLTQGSGLGGLAAMRPVAVIDEPVLTPRPVRLVRPLLAAARAEIVAYALHHHLCWCEDESNADERRSRNLIRRQVLPLLANINPQVVATLARTATLVAAEHERLHALDGQTLRQHTILQDDERLVVRLAPLQQLAPAAVRGLLYTALLQLNANMRAIGAVQLDSVCSSVMQTHQVSGPHPLAGDLAWSVVALRGAELHLALHHRAALPLPPPGPWLNNDQQCTEIAVPVEGEITFGAWTMRCQLIERAQLPQTWWCNPDRWMAFFDADKLVEPVLTTVRSGFRIDPLGMAGQHKRLGDLFTDRKIAPALRSGWPVLLDRTDGRLLWLCGLAQSHSTRITAATDRVWCVHFLNTERRGESD